MDQPYDYTDLYCRDRDEPTYDRVTLTDHSVTIQDEATDQWLAADATVDLGDAR